MPNKEGEGEVYLGSVELLYEPTSAVLSEDALQGEAKKPVWVLMVAELAPFHRLKKAGTPTPFLWVRWHNRREVVKGYRDPLVDLGLQSLYKRLLSMIFRKGDNRSGVHHEGILAPRGLPIIFQGEYSLQQYGFELFKCFQGNLQYIYSIYMEMYRW